MALFFDNDYEPSVIDETSIDDLEMKVGVQGRPYSIESLPDRWAYFAYLKGLENGLSEMYSINFGYTISSFMAGLGVDAGTDVYFTMKVDDIIFNIYENCKNNYSEDKECAKQFFNIVLEWYKSSEGICKYEKAVFHHNIRISCELKNWFENQEQPVRKTIKELMNNQIHTPHEDGRRECNLTFKLSYSEEEMWNKIEGNDVEKLASLLR